MDHKPLVQILNDRSLSDIHNRRLLNLKEKTLEFQYKIMHISAAKNKGPDAVSRYPTPTNSGEGDSTSNFVDEISIEAEASATLQHIKSLILGHSQGGNRDR